MATECKESSCRSSRITYSSCGSNKFDRIFRVLFFYQPGMVIVITSGFQKKTQQTPPGEITKAEQLRKLWMKYRNHCVGSQKEREAILKELGL
jgi:hypothetical protein